MPELVTSTPTVKSISEIFLFLIPATLLVYTEANCTITMAWSWWWRNLGRFTGCNSFLGFRATAILRTMFNLEYSLQQIVAGGDVGGREIAFGLTSHAREEFSFGSIWDVLGLCWVRAIAKVFEKQCLHHQCSKCNFYLQDLTLFWTSKAVAPPPHGEEGRRLRGACCYLSVWTRNSTLPINK